MSEGTPINIFSSNVKKLAMTQRVVHGLPSRGVMCFKSATEIPCKDGSERAIVHCSHRVVRFLRRRGIGTVIITYGATDTFTLSTIGSRLSVPVLKIVRTNTGITTRRAEGGQINVVKAINAMKDNVRTSCLGRLSPRVAIVKGTYPLFIPLMRRN